MASTSTPNLGLFKATPGSLEPFRTTDINSNWDKVDDLAGDVEAVQDDLTALDARVVDLEGVIDGGTP